MIQRKRYIPIILASCAIFLLLFDPKTALLGSIEGIQLCSTVIMPSLFPFIFVCNYLNSGIMGLKIPGVRYIGKILHIPAGGEALLIPSLLGGYPVGAQTVVDMYNNQMLNKSDAKIFLGYCNNAGPAFIFGATTALFSSPYVPWFLWFLHIAASIITGILLPKPCGKNIRWKEQPKMSMVNALQKTLVVCANICGWVILFRLLLTYATKYLDYSMMIFLSGILELSNGCLNLQEISAESIRFILCSIYLSFGGLCVMLQTASVTQKIGLGLYIPGKLIQTAVSTLVAIPLSMILFKQIPISNLSIILILLASTICIVVTLYAHKKSSGIYKETGV